MANKTLEEKRDAKINEVNADCDKELYQINADFAKKIAKRDKKAQEAAAGPDNN